MPIARFEMPDGRIGRFEVPEGTTPEQAQVLIAQSMGQNMVGEKPASFSAGKMIQNIPGSAYEFGKNLVEPFLSPVQTAKNIGNLALGTAQLMTPGTQPEEAYPRAVADMFRQRYGTGSRALQTLQDDPVGVLGDASMALTGGGMAAARAPGMVGKVGSAVQKTGAAIDPLNLALNAPRAGLAMTSKDIPRDMYESAVKLPTTMKVDDRNAVVDTALREGIMPTDKGVRKASQLIESLDSQVTNLIQDAQAQGKMIPRSAVFKFVNEVRKDLGGFKIESSSDMAKIQQILSGYVQDLNKAGKREFSPMELQSIKQDLYRRINYDRDLMQNPGLAREELYKSMARGAREGIEGVAPAVGGLNKREGELIEMLGPLQRAANRIENRDMIGIGTPIKAAAGGPAGAALGILDAPKVKAGLALKLYELQQKGPKGVMLDNDALRQLYRYMGMQGENLSDVPGLLN